MSEMTKGSFKPFIGTPYADLTYCFYEGWSILFLVPTDPGVCDPSVMNPWRRG